MPQENEMRLLTEEEIAAVAGADGDGGGTTPPSRKPHANNGFAYGKNPAGEGGDLVPGNSVHQDDTR